MIKRIIAILLILTGLISCSKKQEMFVVSGKVTDLNGTPIDSAIVRLINQTFKTEYETLSDKSGNYSIKAKKDDYLCLYAIKTPDYRVSKLEYWAWNVPVHRNLTINPQYDRMEIYGINVFEPQVSPFETYMIYFRPMSLSKSQQLVSNQKINKNEFQKVGRTENLFNESQKILNISPDSITANELTIEVNGIKAEIVGIQKIIEYARGIRMYGYCAQIIKPQKSENQESEYDLVSITLHSSETGESGKGEAFVKR